MLTKFIEEDPKNLTNYSDPDLTIIIYQYNERTFDPTILFMGGTNEIAEEIEISIDTRLK